MVLRFDTTEGRPANPCPKGDISVPHRSCYILPDQERSLLCRTSPVRLGFPYVHVAPLDRPLPLYNFRRNRRNGLPYGRGHDRRDHGRHCRPHRQAPVVRAGAHRGRPHGDHRVVRRHPARHPAALPRRARADAVDHGGRDTSPVGRHRFGSLLQPPDRASGTSGTGGAS